MVSNTGEIVLLSDPAKGTGAKASSVLQRNAKLYGPMNALQLDNPSTSWNSDGSASGKHGNFYVLDFGRVVTPVEVRVQFQAGFAAEEVTVHSQSTETGEWESLIELEMEDAHKIQNYSLLEDQVPRQTKALKLVFDECTDFYARIIIYQLQIWGHESAQTPESGDVHIES